MTPEEFSACKSALAFLDYPTIVELGAHNGDDTPEFAKMVHVPNSLNPHEVGSFLHIMVEPDPRNCQAILDREHFPPLSKDRKLVIGAVAKQNEMRLFHFCNGAHGSGSLLRPTDHEIYFPGIKFESAGMVQCYTLDTLFKKFWLGKIDLLWVDVQGAEQEVIQGGRCALAKTRYLFMEAEEDRALYDGQALKPELLAMLPGWELVEDFGYNVLLRNTNFVPPWGK